MACCQKANLWVLILMRACTALRKPNSRRNKQDRQSWIVAELRAIPSLRVNDLASRLGVSTETVRRDLAELDEAGLVNRTYGGATSAALHEPGLAVRETLMVTERGWIAEEAMRLVEPGDILMIGSGATTLHFAKRLAVGKEHLTVITHSMPIAAALAANLSHKVLILPGEYDGREGMIHGADTMEALSRFHANKAILGASGLTAEGPNDAGLAAGLVYGAMMRRSAQTIVLADHTKFNAPSLTVYGDWSFATTLISDELPTGALAEGMHAARAKVIKAMRF